MFKGGVSLESLATVKAVVMDKTGTVTEGNFKVAQIVSDGGYTEDRVLAFCRGSREPFNTSDSYEHYGGSEKTDDSIYLRLRI